jgi:ribosome-associated protein
MEPRKPGEREVSVNTLRRALEIARAEMGYRASRSSGPGGQHAQKNETRIEAFLELDSCSLDEPAKILLRERFGRTVRAVSQDERSQLRNRELARERLLEKIRLALEPVAKRTATKPSRSAILRRLTAKRHRSLAKRRRRPPGAEE